ncbi:MAG: protein translocase subunit SecD [Clostridiaceae bacterium]|jgi:preprotein translocase subunit SecD|nr:protein translocase subunit SecD [Clostridiaceae bacterium]
MKDNRAFKFFAMLVVIAILSYLAFFGLGPEDGRIIKGAAEIRTGIDIRGGISAIMVPDYPEGTEGRNVAEDLASARSIMELRLDAQGIFDKNINVDATNNRIIIDIPWAQNETNYDPRAALDELGSTGRLTFREVSYEDAMLPLEQIPATGPIILDGEDLKTASQSQHPQTGYYNVDLELKDSGVDKFAEATGRLIGQFIGIFIDDECISVPRVNSRINTSQFYIEGNFSLEEAKTLADKIRFGALPVPLKPVSVDAISAQLGQGALDVAVKAGIVAFALICLFMIVHYRLPGLLASLALSALVALQILFLSNTGISVTLPGIGGIILSMGMGVDANVIIFERIKEELRSGKTLRASIESGFKRAFVAIMDSNITTIIVAIVLFILGTGPVKGFGVTLGLGVVLSFITAVSITKTLIKNITAFGFARNKKLYGVKEGGTEA